MPLVTSFPSGSEADGVSDEVSFDMSNVTGKPVGNTPEDFFVNVYDEGTNTMASFNLEEYVARVVSAALLEGAPEEALKAQAVAARSLALKRAEESVHEGYTLCTSLQHCQAFQTEGEPREECVKAASDTKNELLTLDSRAVLAFSHLSSKDKTEAHATIYGDYVSYLVPVKVSNESGFDCFLTTYEFTSEEFAGAFGDYKVDLSGDYHDWIGSITPANSGRVSVIVVGGVNFRGSTVASLLGLNSLNFKIDATNKGFKVSVYGSGTGLGMSACSAILMANDGKDYKEILSYFYPGTELAIRR